MKIKLAKLPSMSIMITRFQLLKTSDGCILVALIFSGEKFIVLPDDMQKFTTEEELQLLNSRRVLVTYKGLVESPDGTHDIPKIVFENMN